MSVLQWCYAELVTKYGTPRSFSGEAQQFVVLGMGKLGGRELNFSSDIDLIFAFPKRAKPMASVPLIIKAFSCASGNV